MNDASSVAWLAQALGITAFAISLVGYLSPCDRRMKIMMTAGTALLSLQFVLFGGWLVAVSLLMNTARTWLSIYRKGLRWFIPVALIQLGIGILMARQLHDALPIAGSIVGSYGLLCLSGPRLRVAMLVTTTLWFFNNLVWGSIGGVLLDVLNATAHLRAIHLQRVARSSRTNKDLR